MDYPENWMKGPGVYVVPVRPNKGLWFDWRENSSRNTAIIPTVKGCNPITGLKTSGFHLEHYEEKCPRHNVHFEGDRLCPECGYRWPIQNYVTFPNVLWWDTWKSGEDGIGRQFFFTEDEMRDVASHMIGKESTVPAFGFAFYRPKEFRPEPVSDSNSRGIYFEASPSDIKYFTSDTKYFTNVQKSDLFGPPPQHQYTSCNIGPSAGLGASMEYSCDAEHSYSPPQDLLCEHSTTGSLKCPSDSTDNKKTKVSLSSIRSKRLASLDNLGSERCIERPKPVKEVSVGAGAKIHQDLVADQYALDSWKSAPDATMTVYFVFQEQFDKMKAKGMKDLKGAKEGMLSGVPVG